MGPPGQGNVSMSTVTFLGAHFSVIWSSTTLQLGCLPPSLRAPTRRSCRSGLEDAYPSLALRQLGREGPLARCPPAALSFCQRASFPLCPLCLLVSFGPCLSLLALPSFPGLLSTNPTSVLLRYLCRGPAWSPSHVHVFY